MNLFGVTNGKQNFKIKNNEEAVTLTASFNYKNESGSFLTNNH